MLIRSIWFTRLYGALRLQLTVLVVLLPPPLHLTVPNGTLRLQLTVLVVLLIRPIESVRREVWAGVHAVRGYRQAVE